MRTMASSSTAGANSQKANGAAVDAKSQVLAAMGELVDAGRAEWSRTASGEVELRLLSGEVFLLGEVTVTRVA
jgi:alpha-D-ribose 1-methylphosphonate 5-triphosphate synthase subunit PhnG